jgi:hypothetical protein
LGGSIERSRSSSDSRDCWVYPPQRYEVDFTDPAALKALLGHPDVLMAALDAYLPVLEAMAEGDVEDVERVEIRARFGSDSDGRGRTHPNGAGRGPIE